MSTVEIIRKRGLAFKLAVMILTSTSLVFFAAFFYNHHHAKKQIMKDMEEDARNLTISTINKVETVLRGIEKIPEYLAYSMEQSPYSEKDIHRHLREFLITNQEVYGSTIALEPLGKNRSVAPYYYWDKNDLTHTSLSNGTYHYLYKDWYQIPKETGRPSWSEPYFDEGAGNIMMTTYSVPFYKKTGNTRKFAGVITADVSLEWLVEIINNIAPHKSGYAFLITQNGIFVTYPDKKLMMKESIFSVAEAQNNPNLRRIGRCMISGSEGFEPLLSYHTKKRSWLYYAPLPSIGWSFGVVFHEDELFMELKELNRLVMLIGGGGFFLIFLIVIFISGTITRPLRQLSQKASEISRGNLDVEFQEIKSTDEVGQLSATFQDMKIALKEYISNLADTTAAKERIESELKIARNIQMSFLPKKFPPFPEKTEFDIFAALEPAREVGGDLYDFFLLDDSHLFISIGDVSGKGVPAALFMAVTKTLMKGIAERGIEPSDLLMAVNRELVQENESMMFVTVFCGILNFKTGRFLYSNAGHNPPVLIGSDGKPGFIDIPDGFLLGVMENVQYQTRVIDLSAGDVIVLYTDGITEAMNSENILYSDNRLLEGLTGQHSRKSSEIVESIIQSVRDHADAEPQSDDITLLVLKYHGNGP